MPINIAPTSNDTNISELMTDVGSGKIQLPDFQRGWTWDDNRIRGILASLTQGYPMGAIMSLQYGSESVRFKYRTIEGVKVEGVKPDFLVLDGQQRLTSMWRATCSPDPVKTRTERPCFFTSPTISATADACKKGSPPKKVIPSISWLRFLILSNISDVSYSLPAFDSHNS